LCDVKGCDNEAKPAIDTIAGLRVVLTNVEDGKPREMSSHASGDPSVPAGCSTGAAAEEEAAPGRSWDRAAAVE
jgi:hypothetical protein